MSTIKSQLFEEIRINNRDAATGLYNVRLKTSIVTDKTAIVLVSFRESNTGAAWMTLPFALPNNYWVCSYGKGYVAIANTNGDMANGVDFKVVSIEV